jgi:hypothetical protein
MAQPDEAHIHDPLQDAVVFAFAEKVASLYPRQIMGGRLSLRRNNLPLP